MNRKLKCLLMLSLAAVGVLWFIGGRLRAAGNEGATDEDRVGALEARIETLEQELASLKDEMSALQAERANVKLHQQLEHLTVPPPSDVQRRRREPAGEINGVPYYIFPLKADGRSR